MNRIRRGKLSVSQLGRAGRELETGLALPSSGAARCAIYAPQSIAGRAPGVGVDVRRRCLHRGPAHRSVALNRAGPHRPEWRSGWSGPSGLHADRQRPPKELPSGCGAGGQFALRSSRRESRAVSGMWTKPFHRGTSSSSRKVRRLRIFGQRDKLKANRSKGA